MAAATCYVCLEGEEKKALDSCTQENCACRWHSDCKRTADAAAPGTSTEWTPVTCPYQHTQGNPVTKTVRKKRLLWRWAWEWDAEAMELLLKMVFFAVVYLAVRFMTRVIQYQFASGVMELLWRIGFVSDALVDLVRDYLFWTICTIDTLFEVKQQALILVRFFWTKVCCCRRRASVEYRHF